MMYLYEALDAVREKAVDLPLGEEASLWGAILQEIRKQKYFDNRYALAIEAMIHSLVQELDDKTAIAMWRETEVGMANDGDDTEVFADSARMDVEMELLEAITNLAYEDAQA